MEQNKTQTELIGLAFKYLNSFKRHRALSNIKQYEKEYDKANFHNMKAYEMIDNLELTLRAIQKGNRDLETDE